ncbi:Lecithin:cholesterol acyltransferase-domain-containing protein [Flammula alnicola]|nr:Lecithin:cholesterol acyltransferase-domain-containing protein [Flammula alnicola]
MVLSKRTRSLAIPTPHRMKVENRSRGVEENVKTPVLVSEWPIPLSVRNYLCIGSTGGVLLGLAFVEPQDIQDLQLHVATLANQYDINLPQLPEFDLSRVEVEWTRLRNTIPELWKFNNDGREFQVGEAMKARGLTAEHPLVLIPGIISTSLESWSTAPEYRPFFRENFTFNKEKWISAMMLDPVTGLDPPDGKIRAAEGIDAASSLIQGYWIWSKIVENLAVVNYDTNNLYLAPYDWRLSFYNLEERDGYYSKLKSTIEGLSKRQKKKVVVAAHSMGCSVLLYFFKWVESPLHGNGGSDWVEGVAKAMAAFLSGEMKDTVQMNPAGAYGSSTPLVLERFFSRKERQTLFRSWAGSASMWIKASENTSPVGCRKCTKYDCADSSNWILEHTPITFQKMLESNYSYGIERDEGQLKRNDEDHRKWSNPLEVRYARDGYVQDGTSPNVDNSECDDPEGMNAFSINVRLWTSLYAAYTNESIWPKIKNGVRMGEGDGTVSLLSLGAMCVEGGNENGGTPPESRLQLLSCHISLCRPFPAEEPTLVTTSTF